MLLGAKSVRCESYLFFFGGGREREREGDSVVAKTGSFVREDECEGNSRSTSLLTNYWMEREREREGGRWKFGEKKVLGPNDNVVIRGDAETKEKC